MNIQEILSSFLGKKLEREELSFYERWAIDYFHDEEVVSDPYISITLRLNLTNARVNYQNNFQQADGASFQGYLIWRLSQALKLESCFSTRKIDGIWYFFDNLPVFTPISVGGDLRFKDVVLENVTKQSWVEFAKYYRDAVDCPDAKFEVLPQEIWALCPFIGNLPNLPFTSFQIHRHKIKTGRPMFYFGQRECVDGNLYVPFSVSFDHANSDPYVLAKLITNGQPYLLAKNYDADIVGFFTHFLPGIFIGNQLNCLRV